MDTHRLAQVEARPVATPKEESAPQASLVIVLNGPRPCRPDEGRSTSYGPDDTPEVRGGLPSNRRGALPPPAAGEAE